MNLSKTRLAALGSVGMMTLALLGGCGPSDSSPAVPSVEWNQQKYGAVPERRPLSAMDISTDKTWVVAREKLTAPSLSPRPATGLATSIVRYRIGGMDCGDCQHLVANELGKLAGVRLVRVSQSPPETIVEYDPAKLTDKQIEGTVAGLSLWPETLPSQK